jgi:uridine phosphorylase
MSHWGHDNRSVGEIHRGAQAPGSNLNSSSYGSCGALTDVPVGSLVIPDACIAITRNWDFEFGEDGDPEKDKAAYIVSKPVSFTLPY